MRLIAAIPSRIVALAMSDFPVSVSAYSLWYIAAPVSVLLCPLILIACVMLVMLTDVMVVSLTVVVGPLKSMARDAFLMLQSLIVTPRADLLKLMSVPIVLLPLIVYPLQSIVTPLELTMRQSRFVEMLNRNSGSELIVRPQIAISSAEYVVKCDTLNDMVVPDCDSTVHMDDGHCVGCPCLLGR